MTEISELKRACFATRCILLAFGLGLSSLAPIIPYAKTRMQIDDAQLGTTLLFFGIGGLMMMPLAGTLVRLFGTRLLSLISGLLVAIVLPFLTLTSTTLTFSFAAFCFGASTGTLNVAINSHAVTVEKKMNTPLMSGFHCLFSAGGLLGGLMFSGLLELGVELAGCALAVSLIMGLLILIQWRKLLPRHEEIRNHDVKKSFAFPEGRVFLLGAICFVAFMSEGSMLDWSGEFLHSSLGYEMAIAGIGYAIFSVSMAFGRAIGDRLNKKFGALVVFQAGAIMAASGFILSVYLNIPYGAFFGFFLIGFGASNLVPIIFTASGTMKKTPSSISLAFVTTLGYLGALLGPACIGYIAQATSLAFAFSCIGGAVALLALCSPLIKVEAALTPVLERQKS